MHRPRPALTLLAMLSLLTAGCGTETRGGTVSDPGGGGGGGEQDAGPEDTGLPPEEDVARIPEKLPKIAVSPHTLDLPATLPGDEVTLVVVIANQGEGHLTLDEIRLATSRPQELMLVGRGGRPWTYRCPCGPFGHRQQQEVPILFRPASRDPINGSLRIVSNDETQPLITIPIASTAPAPKLEVAPARLTWDALDPAGGGGCEFDHLNRRTFQVENAGSDDLFVTEFELRPEAAAAGFEVCPNRWGLEHAYIPEQERAWRVIFWPSYPGTYEGSVVLSSTGGEASVQLQATDTREPHLLADPPLLAWPLGETEGQRLVFSNDGTFPTTVSALQIVPEAAAEAYALEGEAIDPETGGLLAPIETGGQVEIQVVHTAPDAPLEATLVVEHDAIGIDSPLEVPLMGTTSIPMLETAPTTLTFVDAPADEPVTKHLRLHNRGGVAVQVWEVGLGRAPGELPAPLPPFAIEPDVFQATLDPAAGRIFEVTYTRDPGMAANQSICFLASGDDPRRNDPLCTLIHSLLVHEGTPPIAAAEVLPAAEVPVGTEITLDASTSSDADDGDGIASWRWLLLTRPEGAATPLEGDGANVTLTTDVEGTWEVLLEVTDTTGLPSPEVLLSFTAFLPIED